MPQSCQDVSNSLYERQVTYIEVTLPSLRVRGRGLPSIFVRFYQEVHLYAHMIHYAHSLSFSLALAPHSFIFWWRWRRKLIFPGFPSNRFSNQLGSPSSSSKPTYREFPIYWVSLRRSFHVVKVAINETQLRTFVS